MFLYEDVYNISPSEGNVSIPIEQLLHTTEQLLNIFTFGQGQAVLFNNVSHYTPTLLSTSNSSSLSNIYIHTS